MSFSRGFSVRRNKPEMEISLPMYIGRAASQRGGRPVARAQISSPMALVSTTNQQIHKAHAINGTSPIELRHVSSESTSSSSEDSDTSGGSIHSRETTVTDASSVDNSPIATEPEPNHLSCYFKPAVDTHHRSNSVLTSPTSPTRPSSNETTPRLPQRAPSHSKRAHEGVHRKRSIQRMLSPPPSRGGERELVSRGSAEIFSFPHSPNKPAFVEAPKESSPFGKEIAQLDEIAEEFGQVVRSAERDADEVYMEAHGLGRFTAKEYTFEIRDLVKEMFREERPEKQRFGFF